MSIWLWDYFKRPKKDEVVTVAPTRRELGLSVLPKTTTNGFRELLKVSDATAIEYPALKSIAAAQWAVECGWGTSKLALEHRNYAGAKWRYWLRDYGARPVEYDAWDGPDTYAHFDHDADFIRAYWARFDKISAYENWRKWADTPEGFIRYIGPTWVGVSPGHGVQYVKRIITINDQTMRKVFGA